MDAEAEAPTLLVRTTVNGQSFEVRVPTSETLAGLLRTHLGLTGTKVSCDLEICGACTVLLDGLAVSACTVLAAEADGADVRTVEGLARGETLHPLQQAFLDHGALQCGYCTPGFLMTATALLAEQPRPDAETIREYLAGNICRCTGYKPIVEAIQQAAEVLASSGETA